MAKGKRIIDVMTRGRRRSGTNLSGKWVNRILSSRVLIFATTILYPSVWVYDPAKVNSMALNWRHLKAWAYENDKIRSTINVAWKTSSSVTPRSLYNIRWCWVTPTMSVCLSVCLGTDTDLWRIILQFEKSILIGNPILFSFLSSRPVISVIKKWTSSCSLLSVSIHKWMGREVTKKRLEL